MHADSHSIENMLNLVSMGDLVRPLAIRTAVRLRLFDHLNNNPSNALKLADKIAGDASSVERLLEAMCHFGFISVSAAKVYSLTDMGKCLSGDHSLSMRDAFDLAETDIRAWLELEYSVKSGNSGFSKSYGTPHREYRAIHLEEDVRMDRAHQAATRLDLLTLSRVYPWSKAKTIVDVGGGTGTFLAGILAKYTHLEGVLFDLARMTANAPDVLASYGVLERCTIKSGSFFEKIPKDGDLYVMKAVVGGWDDVSCRRILTNIRDAMSPDASLLIIEPTMGVGDAYSRGNLVQLHSLVLYGGFYRSVEDYRRLAIESGFVIERVIPRSTLPILELKLIKTENVQGVAI